MGYDTLWAGEIEVLPPLTKKHRDDLNAILSYDWKPEASAFTPYRRKTICQLRAALSNGVGRPQISFHPTKDGRLEAADNATRNYDERLVWRLLVDHFFRPRGYKLYGRATWSGEDSEDRGIAYWDGYRVEFVPDVVANPGPSWKTTSLAATGGGSGNYLVRWEIELDADSPQHAAELALQTQLDPADFFEVFEVGRGAGKLLWAGQVSDESTKEVTTHGI